MLYEYYQMDDDAENECICMDGVMLRKKQGQIFGGKWYGIHAHMILH